MTRPPTRRFFATVVATLALLGPAVSAHAVHEPLAFRGRAACDRWVAPTGHNRATGSKTHPWATLQYAAAHVHAGCTVWMRDGTYVGVQSIERRFSSRTVFRAVHAYRAILASRDAALAVTGNAGNFVIRGLQLRQKGPASVEDLVYISGSDDGTPAPDHVALIDNVFHDAWGDDLMKIRSAADHITVRGNVFYNQKDGEEHIDVNGVTNITIEGNIFFNDFGGSGRPISRTSKSYITVKDSNGPNDGFLGARRVHIRRNIFLHWQGGDEGLVTIGNDGAPYLEARHVDIVDNLFLGDSKRHCDSALNVHGAADVAFVNNTVTGNLPSDSYAMYVNKKDANPRNQDIVFVNNIWSDPTRTMRTFSNGDRADTVHLVLRRNLYWNGGRRIPGGDLVSPRSDPTHVFANPRIDRHQRHIVLPRWEKTAFRSGNRTIHQEFLRLVRRYGAIPAGSAAIGKADPAMAPPRDILGRRRDAYPDLGAFEA